LGAAGPVAVLLEDLDWADDSSLNLVDSLINMLVGKPFLIVCTTRPSLFDQQPHWGDGLAFHTRIDLKALNRSASKTLVEEILKKVNPLPTVFIDLVVNKAEGNPFFMEELIKMLIEDGVIVKKENNGG
jgi:predicted ATPase